MQRNNSYYYEKEQGEKETVNKSWNWANQSWNKWFKTHIPTNSALPRYPVFNILQKIVK